jgi:hypothetical protein
VRKRLARPALQNQHLAELSLRLTLLDGVHVGRGHAERRAEPGVGRRVRPGAHVHLGLAEQHARRPLAVTHRGVRSPRTTQVGEGPRPVVLRRV